MNSIKEVYSKIPLDIKSTYNLNPFFEYCVKNGIEKPLMRGVSYVTEDGFITASSPEKRMDDTVDRFTFYFLKTLLESAGFEARPDNSIFVTFDEQLAKSYGYLHYVFPIGEDYHYTFSEMVDDYISLSIKMERTVSMPQHLNELYEEVFPAVVRFLKCYTKDERFQLAFKDHVSTLNAVKTFSYTNEKIFVYGHKLFLRLDKAQRYDPQLMMAVWYFLCVVYNTGKEGIRKLLADCGIHSLDDIKRIDPSAAKNLLQRLKYHGDSDLHLTQNIIQVWNTSPEILFKGKYLFVFKGYLDGYEK